MVGLESKEFCPRCASEIYPFSKKYSISSKQYYCVNCAERADSDYLSKNSCSVCSRIIASGEVKFVFPSKAYGSASRRPVVERLVCAPCNSRIASRSRNMSMGRAGAMRLRLSIRKGLARSLMQGYASRGRAMSPVQAQG